MMLTVPTAVSEGPALGIGWAVYTILWPCLAASVVVLPAALLVGLPVTLLLKRLDCEQGQAYVTAAIATGIILPAILATSTGAGWTVGLLLSVPGMLAGGTSASVWARRRTKVRLIGN